MSINMSTVLKVLTVGDGGVGKTTLLHRYKDGIFVSDTQMTLGVEFFIKQIKVGDHNVMLQMWDFGGQEQFRFMLQRYALGAKGALLMIDMTRIYTLERVGEWINICRKDNPDLPIILVGTKMDLVDDIMVDDEIALEVKESYELLDFIKVSSKTGENVNKVFEKLSSIIIERRFNKVS